MDQSLPETEPHVFQQSSHNQYTSPWFLQQPQPVHPLNSVHLLPSTSMVGAQAPYPPMSLFQSFEEMLNHMPQICNPAYFMNEGMQPWPSVDMSSTPSPSAVELQAENRDVLIDPQDRTTAALPGSTGNISGIHLLNPSSTRSQGNVDAFDTFGAEENPLDVLEMRARRLMNNCKAARAYRQKRKDYIRSLESRVKELENQNQALLEEMRAYMIICQPKVE